MGQVNCREDFHKDIYRGAIELFISFPFRVTKTSLGSTFNLLARELSIVTSRCPSSRIQGILVALQHKTRFSKQKHAKESQTLE